MQQIHEPNASHTYSDDNSTQLLPFIAQDFNQGDQWIKQISYFTSSANSCIEICSAPADGMQESPR